MKRLIVMAMLLIVSSMVFAQVKYMQYPLNKAYKGDGDPIEPVTGLRSNAETNVSPKWTAQPPLITGVNDVPKVAATVVDQTQYEVGEIPYQSEVVNGALAYTIPIQVVQAGKGLQPNISLNYNSMQGNGVAGYGWNVSGASVITVVHSDYYFDGTGAPPEKLDKTSAYALDGMRLIKTSEDSNCIYYETETGNIQVINYAPSGKHYFEVLYPEGKTGIFGSSKNSQATYMYTLSKLTDKFSNYIEYSYISSPFAGKNVFLSEIKYGSQSTLLGRITFTYKNRTDYHSAYIAGQELVTFLLLSNIKSYYENSTTLLAEYKLEHTLNKVNMLTSLNCVYQGKALRPLVFQYGSGNTAEGILLTELHSNLPLYFRTNQEYDLIFSKIKFNPLVNDEALIVYPDVSTYDVIFAFDDHVGTDIQYGSLYSVRQDILIYKSLKEETYETIRAGFGFQKMVAADIDGTGKDKLIKINYYEANSQARVDVVIYDSLMATTSKIYNFPETYNIGTVTNPVPRSFLFGDFIGDGKTQMITFHGSKRPNDEGDLVDYSTESKVSLFYLDQSGTGKIMESTIPGVDLFQDFAFTVDMNGNGKAELCVINSKGLTAYSLINGKFEAIISGYTPIDTGSLENREIILGDINRDGKTDILLSPIKGNSSGWVQFLSTGTTMVRTTPNLPIPYNEGDRFLLHDMDGDKYPDLVVKNSSQLTVYLNQSGNFNNRIESTIPVTQDTYLIPGNMTTSSLYYTGEILTINSSLLGSASFDRNETMERLMTSAIDSYGLQSIYNYALFADSCRTTTTQYSYPYQKFIVNTPVVIRSYTYLNDKLTTLLTYNYYDAVLHRTRGYFAGFGQINVNDLIRQQTTINRYDPTKFGALLKTESPQHTSEMTYNLNISSNKKARLTTTSRKDTDLLTGHTISISYLYDTYGNMTSESMTASGNLKKTTTRTYYNNTATSNYIIGVLTSQTVYNTTADGESARETDTYTLNTQNLPVRHEKWFENTAVSAATGDHNTGYNPGYTTTNERLRKGRALLEENEYDQYGNLIKHSSIAFNADTALTTTYQYDIFGRLTRENSPMEGIYTTTKYNKQGQVSETVNHKNHKTTYEYDVFGNVVKTTYPDGTIGSSTLSWSSASEPGMYSITTTVTNEPTVITWYDALGYEIRTSTQRFNGEWLKADKEYNPRRLLANESLPYTGNAPSKWNSYVYDDYERPVEIRYASGSRETFSYNGAIVTSEKDKVITSVTYNALEKPVSVRDTAGTITYKYHPNGQASQITAPGGIVTTFAYDLFGRKISIHDPSAGIITWQYDQAGNVSQETAASGKMIRSHYDRYNRLIRRDVENVLSTLYRYNEDNQLVEERSNNQVTAYKYDSYGRVTEQKDDIVDDRWLRKNYLYTNGVLTTTIFTSRNGKLTTQNYIYNNGYLTEILLDGTTSVWKLVSENSLGIPTEVTTGPLVRSYGYDECGIPISRTVKKGSLAIQDFRYSFDPETRNLEYRTDKLHNKTENFQYDDLNRLTRFGDQSISYDSRGNIITHPNIGTYSYSAANPYGVKSITNIQNIISANTQQISYNAMKQPASIAENNFSATFVYGNDNQRIKMILAEEGNPYITRYYLFNYEVEETDTGITERLYVGGDAYTSPVVLVKEKGKTEINYICRDYLGSITHLTDAAGTVKQELSYDAWGRLRNPSTHALYASGQEPVLLFGRGYTGHEHLQPFGLINMNARLYDPVLGRFLSPDPYIQSPLFSQAFNRYSYAMNNPLKYTDPDGEIAFFIPALIGFAVGYLSYGIITNNWGIKAVYSGLIGAATSTLGAGVMNGANCLKDIFPAIQQLTAVQALRYAELSIINTALNNVVDPFNFEIGKFTLSISPVAMFTMSAMTGSFRFGAGTKVSYHTGHWTFSAGLDAYSSRGSDFGLGTGFAGVSYDNGKQGFSFLTNKYMREDVQASGILGLRFGDFRINFEDDLFGAVQNLQVHDRYRTAALEFGWRDHFVGTQVYTNDPTKKYVDEKFTKNKKGQHRDGYQQSSAIYYSYKHRNNIFRVGWDAKPGGYMGQNMWHRYLFSTPDFKPHKLSEPFIQIGTRQFYTLY